MSSITSLSGRLGIGRALNPFQCFKGLPVPIVRVKCQLARNNTISSYEAAVSRGKPETNLWKRLLSLKKKMRSLTKIQLLSKLVMSHTLDLKYQKKMEGLMSSINHHKVHRNLFIIKGGIEVANCFLGSILGMRR